MVLTVLKGLGKAYLKSKAGKKTAREILDASEKSIQKVINRGGYDIKKPEIKNVMQKWRKQTVKKILKQNKPE
jgi:hypothetical protein